MEWFLKLGHARFLPRSFQSVNTAVIRYDTILGKIEERSFSVVRADML